MTTFDPTLEPTLFPTLFPTVTDAFGGQGTEVTQQFLWLVILGGFVCFAMSWGIGANDVANAFSTSVGAKAVTLRQAVVIAGIFEFVGAVGLGSNVTDTVRKKITEYDLFEGEEDVLMLGMFCALCSGTAWLYLATRYSFPVSTTHSIIGAIVGFSVAAKGMEAVDWESVGWIVAFWVIAPIMSAVGTMILFWPIRALILRKENSYELSLRYWPVFTFIVAFVMTFFLIVKGLKRIDFDYEEQTGVAFAITFGVSAVLALISYFVFIYSGAVKKFVEKSVAKIEKEEEEKAKMKEMTAVSTKDRESVSATSPSSTGGSSEETDRFKKFAQDTQAALVKGLDIDILDDMEQLEKDIHENSEHFDIRTEKSFAWLQVCTAALDIFAHGSNDVANAVAPFAAMVGLYQSGITEKKVAVPEWILVIGAFGMVIGLATYGYKIMKVLGVRMCYMTSTRGYCIELSSAIIIIICSAWGYPASTTHAQVGATIGAGLMEKARSDATLTWRQVINWKLLAQVFLGWILTLVFTGVTTGLLFAVLAYSPYAGDVEKNCDV